MNEDIYVNEGKHLDALKWPFKRYMVLMPEKNNVDALAWLYASFVRMYNRRKGDPEFTYNDRIENIVKGQIRQHFTNIIDVPTLNKVIQITKDRYLDKEKHDSIKVFSNLFSDKLEIRYLFQDCITGSIVPYFYSETELYSELPQEVDFEGGLKPVRVKRPNKRYVRLAYSRYFNRERFVTEDLEDVEKEFEFEDEIIMDENTQIFEEDLVFDDESDSDKIDSSPSKFDIKYLDEGILVYYSIPVVISDNGFRIKTPFDYSTEPWLNVCFNKATKENKELMGYVENHSNLLTTQSEIQKFMESEKDSIYGHLPNCKDIYMAIDGIGDPKLRKYVWNLEKYYVTRNPDFFGQCAKILERLMKKIEFPKSDAEFREYASYQTICNMLDSKCAGIDCTLLKRNATIKKWHYKYKTDKNPNNSNTQRNHFKEPPFDFKSEFLDLMIQSDMSKTPLMKWDSVNKLWSLWQDRNDQDHDNDKPDPSVTIESLDAIRESVFLLCQKIDGARIDGA